MSQSLYATPPLLSVEQVVVFYEQSILALRGVTLKVGKGQMVALLGANGAGKSTTLKAISSLVRAERGEVTEGRVVYQGQVVTDSDPANLVLSGLAQVLEGRHCFTHLTVEQNLLIGGFSGRPSRKVLNQRLEPCLLLSDEPSMGLAPQVVEEIFEILARLNRDEGLSLLVAEQNINIALDYAHYAFVLENGWVVDEGSAAELATRKQMQNYYLGAAQA